MMQFPTVVLRHRFLIALLVTMVVLSSVTAQPAKAFVQRRGTPFEQGFAMEVLGNVTLTRAPAGLAADRGLLGSTTDLDALLKTPLTVHQGNIHPWTMTERSFWSTFRTTHVLFSSRLTESMEARATHDVLTLFRALANDKPSSPSPLELGMYYRTLTAHTFEAEIPVMQRDRVAVWLRGSLSAPRHMETLTAVGHGHLTEEEEPAFYLDFVSVEARGGFGWSLGGGARFQTDSFSISVDIYDVAGSLYWPAAFVRRGLANNQTEIVGRDGYPSFAPLTQGTYSTEKWRAALSPRWDISYEPAVSQRLSAIRISGHEYSLHVGSRWIVNPVTRMSLGLMLPGPALHLGLEWNSWYIGLATAHWSWTNSPTVQLELRRTLF